MFLTMIVRLSVCVLLIDSSWTLDINKNSKGLNIHRFTQSNLMSLECNGRLLPDNVQRIHHVSIERRRNNSQEKAKVVAAMSAIDNARLKNIKDTSQIYIGGYLPSDDFRKTSLTLVMPPEVLCDDVTGHDTCDDDMVYGCRINFINTDDVMETPIHELIVTSHDIQDMIKNVEPKLDNIMASSSPRTLSTTDHVTLQPAMTSSHEEEESGLDTTTIILVAEGGLCVVLLVVAIVLGVHRCGRDETRRNGKSRRKRRRKKRTSESKRRGSIEETRPAPRPPRGHAHRGNASAPSPSLCYSHRYDELDETEVTSCQSPGLKRPFSDDRQRSRPVNKVYTPDDIKSSRNSLGDQRRSRPSCPDDLKRSRTSTVDIKRSRTSTDDLQRSRTSLGDQQRLRPSCPSDPERSRPSCSVNPRVERPASKQSDKSTSMSRPASIATRPFSAATKEVSMATRPVSMATKAVSRVTKPVS